MPPDFEIYSEWASAFLDENDYVFGVTFQLLGYTSCGTTRDYLHSEGIYGWTPEIGGSGFWPMPSTILDLVSENIRPMLYQSWIALVDDTRLSTYLPAVCSCWGRTLPIFVCTGTLDQPSVGYLGPSPHLLDGHENSSKEENPNREPNMRIVKIAHFSLTTMCRETIVYRQSRLRYCYRATIIRPDK